jgi:hypothetical protein
MGEILPCVKCLVVMRCLHLASPALLTQVAGFGENVVTLFGILKWHDLVAIRPQPVEGSWKDGRLRCDREVDEGFSHGEIL